MNDHVRAEPERVEVQRCGVRIVNHCDDIFFLRGGNNGRNVLHFQRVTARALHVNEPSVLPDEPFNSRADQRVIELHFDAEALEKSFTKISGRAVDRIGNENVVAGLDEGKERSNAAR